ncbi:MAG: hypothetical protein J6S23_03335 [Clostridia bacterium]|nr:hypothetical protein [Clostridia bacterium]
MNKILVLLLIIGLVFSFYTNNATSNEESDFSFDSNCIKTEHSFIGNDSKLQFTDDSIDCFDALEKVDVEYVNTDTLYQTQHFATYYFYNLRENMGYNYIGSCSYVAIAMMLSYYDTYWDDTIIDDNYDLNSLFEKTEYVDGILTYSELTLHNFENSPGIRENERLPFDESERLGLSDNERLTQEQYYELVKNQSNRDRYFHYYLMGTMITEEFYASRVSQNINPFGLGGEDREDLIEDYLNASGAKLTYETVTTDIENYIITNVSRGIPVMIAVDLADQNTGHVLVVYDYDASTGKLYANMGWTDGYDETDELVTYTHVDLSSINYTRIKNATTFTPTDSHSHAYNYVYWDGSTYCSCYFPCHLEHEHEYEQIAGDVVNHKYKCGCVANDINTSEHRYTAYQSVDGIYHTKVCTDCGYSVTSEHDMTLSVSLASGTKHGQKCVDCGYVDESTVGTHSFTTWVYLNPTTHVSACDGCNARTTTTASHAFKISKISPDLQICVGCGYTKIFGSDEGFIIMSVMKVSANGSYILPDGTIMLVDEDVEEYLNGTLVFYDKDNVPQTQ